MRWRERRDEPRVAFLVPCFNEEQALPATIRALVQKLAALSSAGMCRADSFIVLVDDGSLDDTWHIIEEAQTEYGARIIGICLSVNAGHQNALVAALDFATPRTDVSISIDADLQDSLDAVDDMLRSYRGGAEMVFGVRRSRDADTPFKRVTAGWYYRLMTALGVDMVQQHADYRLMSRAAMNNLQQFPEYHLFLRGLVKRLHNRVAVVEYDRVARTAGESKYTLRKMLSLAVRGVVSFSTAPLRAVSILGIVVFSVGIVLSLYAIAGGIAGHTVPGWASISAPLYALGGIIMLCIGILGEYVGKIYEQVKARPRYLIDKVVGDQ